MSIIAGPTYVSIIYVMVKVMDEREAGDNAVGTGTPWCTGQCQLEE
jgi:hypothetical protein